MVIHAKHLSHISNFEPQNDIFPRITGSGKQEIFDAAFNVTKRNIYGFAAGPEKVQVVEFPATFDSLTSVEPSIWKPANLRATEGSLVQMAFDEVTYTAHVREDA